MAKAEGGLAIAAGQARLVNTAVRASGADLGLVGSFNVADATLDATLTLTGMPTAATAIRPAVYVALKGPMLTPKRAVDANVLASWLALRAVEQQSKRLDAMEQARREAEQASREAAVPPPAEPATRTPAEPAATPASRHAVPAPHRRARQHQFAAAGDADDDAGRAARGDGYDQPDSGE